MMDSTNTSHVKTGQATPYRITSENGVQCYHFTIKTSKDYGPFFSKFVSGGLLKPQYYNSIFRFYIHLEATQTPKVDEQLFFYPCLIATQFGTKARFNIIAKVNQTYQKFITSPDFFRLETYLMLQLVKNPSISIWIQSSEGSVTLWPSPSVRGLQNLLPLFTVNSRLLSLLQYPITESAWKKILNADKFRNGQEEEILYYLCHRFLFDKIENEACLSQLRTITFRLEDFRNTIKGIPLLALLVFAVFDYLYRTDLANQYKKEIKTEKVTAVQLTPYDFFNELQDIQKYERYQAHQKLQENGLDNKTLLNLGNYQLYRDRTGNARNPKQIIALHEGESGIGWKKFLTELGERGTLNSYLALHPQLVGELYEAIMIAEGILQLLENIIFHAGQWDTNEQRHSEGTGMLSIHIHHCDFSSGEKNIEDDLADMEKHYPSYMKQQKETETESQHPRYYLEIKIADLSTTDIAQKFKDNRRSFIKMSPQKDIFSAFTLKSFFAPTIQENRAWEHFYQESAHVVNHYGLQIFNSIVRSKNGFFYVTSQNFSYNSQTETGTESLPYMPFISGTSYAILLPLHASYTNDKNIYDSMLGYDMMDSLHSPSEPYWYSGFPPMPQSITTPRIKENYISQIYEHLDKKSVGSIRVIDVSKLTSIECTIKGLILYIYRHQQTPIYFALVNCKVHEIVNIVRLISLFYNRQAENHNMGQVQIYIRGEKVGEELLLFGETLPEVENNIAKIACMRGILYENYRVLHDIFRRDPIKGGSN